MPANVILIDRTNHHLFQPLLYQVATSVLTPEQIGSPLCGIFRSQKNVTVLLGEVTGVDKAGKRVCRFGRPPRCSDPGVSASRSASQWGDHFETA